MIPIPYNPEWSESTACERELGELLEEEFLARVGFHRVGRTIAVLAAPREGERRACVDLPVLIYPQLMPLPESDEERESRRFSVEVSLADLQSDLPNLRAAACRRLGQLGASEARAPLQRLALHDSSCVVRELAEAALSSLDEGHLPAAAFVDLGLRLIRSYPHGQVNVGVSKTDARGFALFRDIPSEASCSLELAERWRKAKGAFVPQVLTPLSFNGTEAVEGRIGAHTVRVEVQLAQAGTFFDAVVRMDPPLAFVSADVQFELVACSHNQVWHPTRAASSTGEIHFSALPLGTYQLILAVVRGPEQARRDSPRSSDADGLDAADAIAHSQRLQIVHPPDRRLLAVVERDSNGCALVTIETEAPALANARVAYQLGSESGQVALTSEAGGPVWRATLPLPTAFTGDEGQRLLLWPI